MPKTKVTMDLAALQAAAERPDSTHAYVARLWLRDVHLIVTGQAELVLLQPGEGPTPMVHA